MLSFGYICPWGGGVKVEDPLQKAKTKKLPTTLLPFYSTLSVQIIKDMGILKVTYKHLIHSRPPFLSGRVRNTSPPHPTSPATTQRSVYCTLYTVLLYSHIDPRVKKCVGLSAQFQRYRIFINTVVHTAICKCLQSQYHCLQLVTFSSFLFPFILRVPLVTVPNLLVYLKNNA
jgi:hypothetical protein